MDTARSLRLPVCILARLLLPISMVITPSPPPPTFPESKPYPRDTRPCTLVHLCTPTPSYSYSLVPSCVHTLSAGPRTTYHAITTYTVPPQSRTVCVLGPSPALVPPSGSHLSLGRGPPTIWSTPSPTLASPPGPELPHTPSGTGPT